MAFDTYFGGIDTGDYLAAWNVLGPRLRANGRSSGSRGHHVDGSWSCR